MIVTLAAWYVNAGPRPLAVPVIATVLPILRSRTDAPLPALRTLVLAVCLTQSFMCVLSPVPRVTFRTSTCAQLLLIRRIFATISKGARRVVEVRADEGEGEGICAATIVELTRSTTATVSA